MGNWLKNLTNTVTNLFHFNKPVSQHPAAPKIPVRQQPSIGASQGDWYSQTMGDLDRIQNKLNPFIGNANNNASVIHNYLAGNYSRPNPGTSNAPLSDQQQAYAFSKGEQPSVANYIIPDQSQSSNYSSFVPFLKELGEMTKPQPSYQQPVDMTPYLQQAATIRQQRQQNEQALQGGFYG